jgi:predicted transcriptional regulator
VPKAIITEQMVRMASIAIDDELHKRLKIQCSILGVKIKNISNEALEDWLKRSKPKSGGHS